jgi:hypothetical protein
MQSSNMIFSMLLMLCTQVNVCDQPSPWPSKRGRVTGCHELAGCQFRKISELGRAGRPSKIRNNFMRMSYVGQHGGTSTCGKVFLNLQYCIKMKRNAFKLFKFCILFR